MMLEKQYVFPRSCRKSHPEIGYSGDYCPLCFSMEIADRIRDKSLEAIARLEKVERKLAELQR